MAPKETAETTTEKSAETAGDGCSIDKCKQPVRAKGLCRKHYIGWRRGKLGAKHRYNTCGKEACRKKALADGLCEEHTKLKKPEAAAAT